MTPENFQVVKFNLLKSDLQKLNKLAQKYDTTKSQILRELVKQFIEADEEEEKIK